MTDPTPEPTLGELHTATRLLAVELVRLHASRRFWRRFAAMLAGSLIGLGALAAVVAANRRPDAVTALLAAAIAGSVMSLIVRHSRWVPHWPCLPGEDGKPLT